MHINPNWHPARIVEEDEPTVRDTERPEAMPEPGMIRVASSEGWGWVRPSPHLDMLRTILRDAMSYQLCRPWCEQDDIELERKCQAAIDSMALLRESLAIDATEPPDCDSGVWAGEGE